MNQDYPYYWKVSNITFASVSMSCCWTGWSPDRATHGLPTIGHRCTWVSLPGPTGVMTHPGRMMSHQSANPILLLCTGVLLRCTELSWGCTEHGCEMASMLSELDTPPQPCELTFSSPHHCCGAHSIFDLVTSSLSRNFCFLGLWDSRASWSASSLVPWLPSPCWLWKVRSSTWTTTYVCSSVSPYLFWTSDHGLLDHPRRSLPRRHRFHSGRETSCCKRGTGTATICSTVLFCTCSCWMNSRLSSSLSDLMLPRLSTHFFDTEPLLLFTHWRLGGTTTIHLVSQISICKNALCFGTFWLHHLNIDCQTHLPNRFLLEGLGHDGHLLGLCIRETLMAGVFELAVISSFNWTTRTRVCSTLLCPCPPSAWSPWTSSSHHSTTLTARSLPARLSGLCVQNPLRNFGNWLTRRPRLPLGRWSLVILFATVCSQHGLSTRPCCAGSQMRTGLTVARDLQLGGYCQRSDCCVVRCSDSPLWLVRLPVTTCPPCISRLNFLLVAAEHKFLCFSWRWPPHDWSWMQRVSRVASCCLWLLARSFCCCFWKIDPFTDHLNFLAGFGCLLLFRGISFDSMSARWSLWFQSFSHDDMDLSLPK